MSSSLLLTEPAITNNTCSNLINKHKNNTKPSLLMNTSTTINTTISLSELQEQQQQSYGMTKRKRSSNNNTCFSTVDRLSTSNDIKISSLKVEEEGNVLYFHSHHLVTPSKKKKSSSSFSSSSNQPDQELQQQQQISPPLSSAESSPSSLLVMQQEKDLLSTNTNVSNNNQDLSMPSPLSSSPCSSSPNEYNHTCNNNNDNSNQSSPLSSKTTNHQHHNITTTLSNTATTTNNHNNTTTTTSTMIASSLSITDPTTTFNTQHLLNTLMPKSPRTMLQFALLRSMDIRYSLGVGDTESQTQPNNISSSSNMNGNTIKEQSQDAMLITTPTLTHHATIYNVSPVMTQQDPLMMDNSHEKTTISMFPDLLTDCKINNQISSDGKEQYSCPFSLQRFKTCSDIQECKKQNVSFDIQQQAKTTLVHCRLKLKTNISSLIDTQCATLKSMLPFFGSEPFRNHLIFYQKLVLKQYWLDLNNQQIQLPTSPSSQSSSLSTTTISSRSSSGAASSSSPK